MARMSITFDGFKDLAYQIDKCSDNLETAVEDALLQTQAWIQNNLRVQAAPYAGKGVKGYATGHMYQTIIEDGKVDKTGTVYEVRVGFDLGADDGFHSIFVMYGTPRMAKDQKIYDAIRGTKVKKEIAELQEQVMRKYLVLGED